MITPHTPTVIQRLPQLLILAAVLCLITSFHQLETPSITRYVADPKKENICLFWKDNSGQILGSLENLKKHVEGQNKKLLLGMNAGMYMENRAPLGLYIEKGKILNPVNTKQAKGNFYLQPNGIFYITKDITAGVCETSAYSKIDRVEYATQSGPMLVVNKKMHPAFTKGSNNLNIRNGVGILPNGKVLFAISKQPINFYDFALFFLNAGCSNALYLDGFVSRAFIPSSNHNQMDGNFGVMIAVSESQKSGSN